MVKDVEHGRMILLAGRPAKINDVL